MEPIRDPEVLARMRTAFDLSQAAEDIMRQNLRRRFPHATEEQIERRLLSWLRKEPDPYRDIASD
jgi:lauroyl/myristoyl acyltransferase